MNTFVYAVVNREKVFLGVFEDPESIYVDVENKLEELGNESWMYTHPIYMMGRQKEPYRLLWERQDETSKEESQPEQTGQLKEAELHLFEKIKELAAKTKKEAQQIGVEFSEQGFSKKEMRKIVTAVTFDHIKNDREKRKALDNYSPRETFLIDSIKSMVYTQVDIED